MSCTRPYTPRSLPFLCAALLLLAACASRPRYGAAPRHKKGCDCPKWNALPRDHKGGLHVYRAEHGMEPVAMNEQRHGN